MSERKRRKYVEKNRLCPHCREKMVAFFREKSSSELTEKMPDDEAFWEVRCPKCKWSEIYEGWEEV